MMRRNNLTTEYNHTTKSEVGNSNHHHHHKKSMFMFLCSATVLNLLTLSISALIVNSQPYSYGSITNTKFKHPNIYEGNI